MKSGTLRVLSVVLAAIMLVSTFAAFGASAEIKEYLTYEEARNGDLLYSANFNGTDGIWAPKPGSGSWDPMTAVVSEDGRSVVLTPCSKDDAVKGRCNWGGALDNTKYPIIGAAYTVEFTVTAEDDKQEVGFYPDYGTGFLVTPGQNRYCVGQYGNQTKVLGRTFYTGTASLTQTYAVEFREGRGATASYPDNDLYCSDYSLYVKNGDEWSLIYSLSNDVMCKDASLSTKGQLEAMGWTLDPSDPGDDFCFRFFRSPGDSNQTGTVTISNLNLYKGLTIGGKVNPPAAPAGNININSKEDGELLYKLNFKGDENFAPAAFNGLPLLNTEVDANDNGKVTISVPAAETGVFHYWGGPIAGLPLDDQNEYTIFIEVERSIKTSPDADPYFGFSLDGLYFMNGDSATIQLVKGGIGKVRSAVTYEFTIEPVIVGDHGEDYDKTTEPFVQKLAVEISGPEKDVRAIRVYALSEEGKYELATNSDSSSNVQFMNDTLSFYLLQSDAGQPVSINSVEIYKGMNVEAFNEKAGQETTAAETTAAEPVETTAAENPADTTAAAPVETTAGEPAVTTEKQAEKKSGCGSAVSVFSAVIAILGTAVVFSKKKEN